MLVRGISHLDAPDDDGDPCVYCERIEITTHAYKEANNELARLFRMLIDPETRMQLLGAALAIEADEQESVAAARAG